MRALFVDLLHVVAPAWRTETPWAAERGAGGFSCWMCIVLLLLLVEDICLEGIRLNTRAVARAALFGNVSSWVI